MFTGRTHEMWMQEIISWKKVLIRKKLLNGFKKTTAHCHYSATRPSWSRIYLSGWDVNSYLRLGSGPAQLRKHKGPNWSTLPRAAKVYFIWLLFRETLERLLNYPRPAFCNIFCWENSCGPKEKLPRAVCCAVPRKSCCLLKCCGIFPCIVQWQSPFLRDPDRRSQPGSCATCSVCQSTFLLLLRFVIGWGDLRWRACQSLVPATLLLDLTTCCSFARRQSLSKNNRAINVTSAFLLNYGFRKGFALVSLACFVSGSHFNLYCRTNPLRIHRGSCTPFALSSAR